MSTSPDPYVEPWLRGTHAEVPSVGSRVAISPVTLIETTIAALVDYFTICEVV
jgi:hypothetical protein